MAGRMKSIHLISPKASEYQPGADLYKEFWTSGSVLEDGSGWTNEIHSFDLTKGE